MRLYYHDALIFKRLLDGTANEADCAQPLVYFRADALQAARLREMRGDGAGESSMPRIPDTTDVRGESVELEAARQSRGSELESDREPGTEAKLADADDSPPYCPSYIHLRLFVIELDCAMRVLHLLIYGLVLFGRYIQIKDDDAGDFDCSQLITYFANV